MPAKAKKITGVKAGARAMYCFWYGEPAKEYDAAPPFVHRNFERMFLRGLKELEKFEEANRG